MLTNEQRIAELEARVEDLSGIARQILDLQRMDHESAKKLFELYLVLKEAIL